MPAIRNRILIPHYYFVKFFCLLLSVYLFLFIVTPVSAQTSLSSPAPTTITKPVDVADGQVLGWADVIGDILGFIKRLAGSLTEKKVPEDIRTYDQASLPSQISIDGSSPPADFPLSVLSQGQGNQESGSELTTQAAGNSADSPKEVVAKTANYYDVSKNINQPLEKASGFQSFWERILDWLGLLKTGNESAQDLLNVQMPPGVAEQVLTRSKNSQSLSYKQESADVLAFPVSQEVSEYAMRDAVDAARCANLPPGMGDCANSGLLNPVESPTPTPQAPPPGPDVSPVEPPPDIVPPPDMVEFPQSKNGDLYCANQIPAASSLIEIFRNAGSWKNIPGVILASLGCIEWSAMFRYSDGNVGSYGQENGEVPNCHPNSCAAMGPMQITVGIDNTGSTSCSGCGLTKCGDSWSKFGDAAIAALGRNTTLACNLTDSIYAAAKILDFTRQDKAGYAAAGNTYSHYCAAATDSWTDPNLISCAAGAYYGECRPCVRDASGQFTTYACNRFYNAFGEAMNYCQFAVKFYNQWKSAY